VDAAAVEEAITKAPAQAKGKPATKAKPAKAQAASKPNAPSKSFSDDPDDDGGTYALLDKPGEEGEGIKLTYEPDTSIKDLRGPAVAAVVPPSNAMLWFGASGCLVNLFIVLVQVWPFIFADNLLDHKQYFEEYYLFRRPGVSNDEFQKGLTRIKNIPDDRKDLLPEEKDTIAKAEGDDRMQRIIVAITYFMLIIYNGVIVVGATKMQYLESRTWGIVAAVMTLVILSDGPLLWLTYNGASMLVSSLFERGELIDWFSYGNFLLYLMLVGACVPPVGIGIWSLKVLNRPEVRAGFEYVPDDGFVSR
jgi:hypothetical protein